MTNCYLNTCSNRTIDVLYPKPGDISIDDIAAGLSKICRWNGQIPEFLSVAQHSLMAAALVPDQFKMMALLHDATEAYICDLPKPFKEKMELYKIVEANLSKAIYMRFNVNTLKSRCVEEADHILLEAEARYFSKSVDIPLFKVETPGITCAAAMKLIDQTLGAPPAKIEKLFVNTFKMLSRRRANGR